MRVARAAEVASAVVFGVSVDDLRTSHETPAKLARLAAVSATKEIAGETWGEVTHSIGVLRGEPVSTSALRGYRREWSALTAASSSFASALRELYETVVKHTRLQVARVAQHAAA